MAEASPDLGAGVVVDSSGGPFGAMRESMGREWRSVIACVVAIAAAAFVAGCGSSSTSASQSAATGSLTPLAVSSSRVQSLVLKSGRRPPARPTVGTGKTGAATASRVELSQLAGTGRLRATITVSHECGRSAASCDWFGEASQRAGSKCPLAIDSAHSIWKGAVQRAAGTQHATVTFQPLRGAYDATVCVYAQAPPSAER